ncbi:Crp/Fnr family transcriptional regulator [Pseudooceanicola onchidii]|uniref:Crp/Fnr family transcriptional regulator n=1 Tax=Pseudooceanicola onchidii TaxID=2562279 RepID=UPI0010AAAFB7|nr:Crp/Fnr family transcriptional regulator [Pseudooceanicola onchidii]
MQQSNPNIDTSLSRAEAEKMSCFASRLNRYAELDADEMKFIARMEETERRVVKGGAVMRQNAQIEDLFVLKEGWAIASSRPSNDRAQTVRVYLPGEVIGLPGLGVKSAPYDVRMVTDGVVCPFPKDHVTAVYARSPRLAALFMAISGLDQITLKDRLAMMGAGDARQRMAHFLLDVHERLQITNPNLGRRFRLPLRQVDIAEVLGLTKVYVNRLLRSFTEDGLIEIERPYVRILQPNQLREMVDYQNRYDDLDTSWFPSRATSNGI